MIKVNFPKTKNIFTHIEALLMNLFHRNKNHLSDILAFRNCYTIDFFYYAQGVAHQGGSVSLVKLI